METTRDHEILQFKTAILLTAQKIAAEKGWSAVSMRHIGNELGVSASLLYTYYQNKEEILMALENQGFSDLNKRLKTIRKKEKDPEKALIRMTTQIFEFASSRPELYQVMFNLEGVKCGAAKGKLIAKTAKNFKAVLQPFAKGKLTVDTLHTIWWSMAHGYTSLLMTDQLKLSSKKGRKELEKMARTLVRLHRSY